MSNFKYIETLNVFFSPSPDIPAFFMQIPTERKFIVYQMSKSFTYRLV